MEKRSHKEEDLMPNEVEYNEGPEALNKFNKPATKLFRAPRPFAKDSEASAQTEEESQQG